MTRLHAFALLLASLVVAPAAPALAQEAPVEPAPGEDAPSDGPAAPMDAATAPAETAATAPDAPAAPAPAVAAPAAPAAPVVDTAAEPFARHFGIQYGAGVASFIGDLRGPDAVFVQDIQGKVLHISTLDDHLRFYLAIDLLMLGARAEGGRFTGYDAGAELGVLAFLFIPMACGAPNELVQVCGGIGQGTVNVNAEGDRRDWGTWNYQLQVDVSPFRWLQLTVLGKYIGAVEQQVDGVDSAFSFFTITGGAGLTF